jgi:GT2 family glycosyltransferase/glycosyltransferase involved in cell wall biosynthesis
MRVLQIVHGYPPAASGGTEVYTRNLARALAARRGDSVFVLTRTADRSRPELSATHERDGSVHVCRINNTFQSCASFEESYTNPALLAVASREIASIAPDVVHVQHLTCLSTLLLEALSRERIPIVMTLNDYWLMCHRGQLFDLDGRCCEGPFAGGCRGCLPAGALATPLALRAGRAARASEIPGLAAAAHQAIKMIERATPRSRTAAASLARLRHMQSAARHVDLFLAPSSTIDAWFRRFGIPEAKLRRWEQGIDTRAFGGGTRTSSPVLRIGYAGGLIPSKAPHLLLEAARRLPRDPISIDMLGGAGAFHGDDSYARQIAPLLARAPLGRLGPVPPERMPDALHALDLLVVPSVWRENAPFIIREAFAARLPVVAADFGGMAEMVRHDVDGLLFEPGSAAALADSLARVLNEPVLLDRLRSNIRPPLSIEQDAARLRSIYEDLGRPRRGAVGARRADRDASSLGAVVLNFRTREQTWIAVRSLQTSRRMPDRIIIVDNGSNDGSVEWLRHRLEPAVEILPTGANLGFSAGCNAGLSRILEDRTDVALLLNSDVVLHPDAITALLSAAHEHPEAGVLAPVLLSREEPDRIASAGITYSRQSGRMRHRAAGRPLAALMPGVPHEVDAVSGAVMLIRADALRRVGLFADEFFFSFEDVELCLRVRAAGFGVMCVPAAIAYHEGGRTIGRRSPARVYYATRNHLCLSARTGRGGRLAGAARASFVVGLNAAYALTSREVPLFSGMAAVVRGTLDYARGRYGPA